MDRRIWTVLMIVFLSPLFVRSWKSSNEDRRQARELRRGVHYHSKRNMMPGDMEPKRRTSTQRSREMRKKPSGHLTPLDEDDMENDEVVSVAIGPPPIRPKYEMVNWKNQRKNKTVDNFENCTTSKTATNLVKDVLTQIGREFLTRQVSEDFVFGQYVGNAMRNLTSELRLRMQHEILELVVKYQSLHHDAYNKVNIIQMSQERITPVGTRLKEAAKDITTERRNGNDTDETWPDFSNLAKIVG